MRVLLANKFLYPKGGAERAVLDLGRGLEERGHQVFWFGMHHPDNTVPEATSAVVRQRDYRAGRKRYADAVAMIYSREARQRFAALLEAASPDIVHLHNIYHQLTPSILDAARDAAVPVVMTLHDYKLVCPRYDMLRHGRVCDRCVEGGPLACLRSRCAGSWGSSLLLTTEALVHRQRRSYDTVRRFLTPSRFLRRVMQRGGWEADRLVHVGNFLPPFATDATQSPPESAHRFLYAGRLSAEKGIGTLLQAAARLQQGTLVVCGGGPEEGQVREAAARWGPQRLEWKGHVSQEVLATEMQRAAFVVVPSEWFENAPFAVLEAMAAGRPVLASRMGGLPELVEDGMTGILVPPGDVDAWVRALQQAVADPEGMQRMGRQAAQTARERFGFEHHLDSVETLYREVLQ